MRIIFVANYLPDTNYTRDLSQGFIQVMNKNDELFLCGRKHEPVLDGKTPQVDLVWNKGTFFFVSILFYILKRSPGLIHLQHEFKMYGGILSALIFPWFVLLLKILGFKIVITSHGIVSKKQLSGDFLTSFGLKDTVFNKVLVVIFLNYVYKLMVRFSDVITVHAPFLQKILVEEYLCDAQKVIVVEHGIREIRNANEIPTNPSIYKKFPILKNKKIILVFGYFSPRKGYEVLINSFAQISKKNEFQKWIIVLAGDVNEEFSAYRLKIERLIKKLKLRKSILITGYINAQEVNEYYRVAKVSIIPALFSFNTSGALAMTLAYKKPLIVANVKPISEEIRTNKIGLLFENSNVASFGKELKKILFDKKTYNRIMLAVEKTAARRYWRIIAKEHYEIYRKILYDKK